MFKNKFNLNGVDYKIVNDLVHKPSKGILEPCYQGDSRVLDEYCRTHNFTLYQRPKGLHAYGHQTGIRGKTLEQTRSEHIPPLEHAQVTATKKRKLSFWDFVIIFSVAVIGLAALELLYELIFVNPGY